MIRWSSPGFSAFWRHKECRSLWEPYCRLNSIGNSSRGPDTWGLLRSACRRVSTSGYRGAPEWTKLDFPRPATTLFVCKSHHRLYSVYIHSQEFSIIRTPEAFDQNIHYFWANFSTIDSFVSTVLSLVLFAVFSVLQ